MDCKKAQDLILTDYLDGSMTDDEKRALEAHFVKCSRCRAVAETAGKEIAGQFNKAERISPPESVWQNLREAIGREKIAVARSPVADFLEKLRSLRVSPRPVFATATVAAAVLVAVVIARLPVQNRIAVSDYLDEQATFLTSLQADANGAYEDLGTSIEEYLL